MSATTSPWTRTLATALLAACVGLGSACSSDSDDCPLNENDPAKYVIVGFWKTTDCSGDPVQKNAFPVTADAPCYCWPGGSGENSAHAFSCDKAAKTFTYKQHTDLVCGEGSNSNVKTVHTDKCVQDNPPTLYARILDYGACAN